MVLSFRAEMEHPGNSVGAIFCFITYESNQGSCMLIVARGNPRLLALTDSPVKLVASVIRVWWGGGEGNTTLLNNHGATQVKNSKVSLEGTAILHHQHGRNSFSDEIHQNIQ